MGTWNLNGRVSWGILYSLQRADIGFQPPADKLLPWLFPRAGKFSHLYIYALYDAKPSLLDSTE